MDISNDARLIFRLAVSHGKDFNRALIKQRNIQTTKHTNLSLDTSETLIKKGFYICYFATLLLFANPFDLHE